MLETLKPKRFGAYDLFRWHEFDFTWGKNTLEVFAGKTHRDYYQSRFADLIGDGTMRLYEGDSSTNLMSDETGYDLIYVDGDHSLEGVGRDSIAAVSRIKSGGVLIFNDYIMYDHVHNCPYGVVNVVNDLCVNQGWKIIGLALQEHMFCDVALERV